jgi:hypothetical protein
VSTTVKRPEPVLQAGKLAGAVAAALLAGGGLLRTVGWLPVGADVEGFADQSSNVVLAIGGLWALTGPWLTARLRARDLVTPIKDPQDNAGNRLLSPQVALLSADYPEYAALIPATLGAGGMTYDVVRDYLQTLREAAERKLPDEGSGGEHSAPETHEVGTAGPAAVGAR